MGVKEKAGRLAAYTSALHDFRIAASIDGHYEHIGATIADAILQPGLRYDSVVRKRRETIRTSYPHGKTTSGFLAVLEKHGVKSVLEWKHDEKPRRLEAVTRLFKAEGVETEAQLCAWLRTPQNIVKLQSIKGIKKKTTDYFGKLVGIETCAPDTHLFAFLNDAGIPLGREKHDEAKSIINSAALLLGLKPAVYDQSIWDYKSGRGKKKPCRKGIAR